MTLAGVLTVIAIMLLALAVGFVGITLVYGHIKDRKFNKEMLEMRKRNKESLLGLYEEEDDV